MHIMCAPADPRAPSAAAAGAVNSVGMSSIHMLCCRHVTLDADTNAPQTFQYLALARQGDCHGSLQDVTDMICPHANVNISSAMADTTQNIYIHGTTVALL